MSDVVSCHRKVDSNTYMNFGNGCDGGKSLCPSVTQTLSDMSAPPLSDTHKALCIIRVPEMRLGTSLLPQ